VLIVSFEGGSGLELITVEIPKERSGVTGRVRAEGDDLCDLKVDAIICVGEPSTKVFKVGERFS
jgi:hypothetical protein